MQINSYLVKHLKISHQEATKAIVAGDVFIDSLRALQKQNISDSNHVKYKDVVLQDGRKLFYYAYHKPVGVESTLNLKIPNNLIAATAIQDYFFPIGRLDKASEGLMILTNDGILYKKITDHQNLIEKCYEVKVDQEISDVFIRQMELGVEIMGQKTKPCKVLKIDNDKFEITLIEGRNRQIRRMCYQLGVEVLVLKRIAIGKLKLGEIAVNSFIEVNKDSIV